MNRDSRDKLIWNAVPTVFDVPNPPKGLSLKRPPPKKRLPAVLKKTDGQFGLCFSTCTGVSSMAITGVKTRQILECHTGFPAFSASLKKSFVIKTLSDIGKGNTLAVK